MTYNLQLTKQAKDDVDKSVEYYDSQSPNLGIEFYLEFLDFCNRIENNPERYPTKYPPYRRALMKKFPYIIFYEVDVKNNTIDVFAIWHNKRDYRKLKDRLK